MRARGAMVSTRARSCTSWRSVTRSVLLMTTMSAVLICSRARLPYPASGSTARSASISEIILWTSTKPCAIGDKNVSATATGRETPLVSITMWSGSRSRSRRLITSRKRSSRIVQQTQPLARLTVSPSTATISLASMLIEPKSFTRTATRRPSEWCRTWLTSEVLPEPRNPPMMVSGTSEVALDPPAGGVSLGSDGKTEFFNYGLADLAKNRPVATDSIFNLGSVGKVFATTLLAQAVKQGELSLDDPVAKYVTELQRGG